MIPLPCRRLATIMLRCIQVGVLGAEHRDATCSLLPIITRPPLQRPVRVPRYHPQSLLGLSWGVSVRSPVVQASESGLTSHRRGFDGVFFLICLNPFYPVNEPTISVCFFSSLRHDYRFPQLHGVDFGCPRTFVRFGVH